MRALLAATAALALTGCQPKCGPGEICTWFGTPQTSGMSDEGTHRLDAETFWVVDVSFRPSDGTPFVIDWNNHRVVRLDENDEIVIVTGHGGLLGDGPEGPALDAEWNHPTDIAWLSDDTMVMAAWHNSRIATFDPSLETMDFIAGTGGRDFVGDGGPAEDAVLDLPVSVAVDDDDNIYLADMANQRIRMIDGDGVIDTVAGNGEHGFNGDGSSLDTSFASPALQRAEPAFKMDRFEGKFYIADTHNGRIRVWDPEADTITTIAGIGQTPENSDNGTTCAEGCGYAGDGGPAIEAELHTPTDVAVGPDGSVYIADTDNSCIRVIDTDGIIDTFAGICGERGFDGDGKAATKALLDRPFGVEVGPDGTVYISDTYNSVVRAVTPE
ncbi:MAG: hypothetical protein EP330_15040 [Deltaproteobacteria bacterium]|nr:MAG: hypothetical protein EP330_15040 [Deltaproteobacteria bacterium]